MAMSAFGTPLIVPLDLGCKFSPFISLFPKVSHLETTKKETDLPFVAYIIIFG